MARALLNPSRHARNSAGASVFAVRRSADRSVLAARPSVSADANAEEFAAVVVAVAVAAAVSNAEHALVLLVAPNAPAKGFAKPRSKLLHAREHAEKFFHQL